MPTDSGTECHQQAWICMFDPCKKFQKYYPKWWFDGDLPWHREKHHLKQIQAKPCDFSGDHLHLTLVIFFEAFAGGSLKYMIAQFRDRDNISYTIIWMHHEYSIIYTCVYIYTLPETDMALKHRPGLKRKETGLPTIHFQVRAVSLREGTRWPLP